MGPPTTGGRWDGERRKEDTEDAGTQQVEKADRVEGETVCSNVGDTPEGAERATTRLKTLARLRTDRRLKYSAAREIFKNIEDRFQNVFSISSH